MKAKSESTAAWCAVLLVIVVIVAVANIAVRSAFGL